MTAIAYILAALVLLAANFFFVLAEFACVRMRAARVEVLVETGSRRARTLQRILTNIDEYLSVVQIGITAATLGIGYIIDDGLAESLKHCFGSGPFGRVASLVLAFLGATYVTVVVSELVPKALAIRHTERAALWCAPPLAFCHLIFKPLLVLLTRSATLILRLTGTDKSTEDDPHSEEELRIILSRSEEGDVLSLRRLLMFENVFDLGTLTVRDAMCPRSRTATLHAGMDRTEAITAIGQHRFSRYPLIEPGAGPGDMPIGVIHVKDFLVKAGSDGDLRRIVRPFATFREDAPLERVLDVFQRSRNHLAVVVDTAGSWVGVVTFEDVIEEIIGQIEDEFEREEALSLADITTVDSVALDVLGSTLEEVIAATVHHVRFRGLPPQWSAPILSRQLCTRERAFTSYVGKGVAIPHLRVDGLPGPALAFGRSARALAVPGRTETARIIFILLTPGGAARVHLRLMARLAHLLESDYVLERLCEATTSSEILETIVEGDRTVTG